MGKFGKTLDEVEADEGEARPGRFGVVMGDEESPAEDAAEVAAPSVLKPHQQALVDKVRPAAGGSLRDLGAKKKPGNAGTEGGFRDDKMLRPDVGAGEAAALAGLNAGGAPLGGIPYQLNIEDIARNIAGKPVGTADNPIDTDSVGGFAKSVGGRLNDLYDTSQRAMINVASDPVGKLSRLAELVEGRGNVDKYQDQLAEIRQDHPIASFAGSFAPMVASGPASVEQSMAGGAMQAIPNLRGDAKQDALAVGLNTTLGGAGFKYPLATSAGLAGYGAAKGDVETTLGGLVGVAGATVGKGAKALDYLSQKAGARSDAALAKATAPRVAKRDAAANRLSEIDALINERQAKLPEIAEGRAAQAKTAELTAESAAKQYESSKAQLRQQLESDIQQAEAMRAQGQADHQQALIDHADSFLKARKKWHDDNLALLDAEYQRVLGSELFAPYDVSKNTKTWMEEVKGLGTKLRDEDSYNAKTQELIRAIDSIQRSREGKIGRAAQGDYQALAQMKQLLTPEQIADLKSTPEGLGFLQRVEDGAAQWAQERVKQPAGKDQADFELAGELQAAMQRLVDHQTKGRDRIAQSRDPAKAVSAEQALALLREKNLAYRPNQQSGHPLGKHVVPLDKLASVETPAVRNQAAVDYFRKIYQDAKRVAGRALGPDDLPPPETFEFGGGPDTPPTESPIKIAVDPDGRMEIIDGNHRLHAARSEHAPNIYAEFVRGAAGDDEPTFTKAWGDFLAGKGPMPDKFALTNDANDAYGSLAASKARRLGYEVPSGSDFDPAHPPRKWVQSEELANEPPIFEPVGPDAATAVKGRPAKITAPKPKLEKPQLLPPPKDGGTSEAVYKALDRIQAAEARAAQAKAGLESDPDSHPKVFKTKKQAEKAAEMARLKRQRAQQAEELVKDPSKDPLIQRRTQAKQKSLAELEQAAESAKPERILEEGRAAIREDRDVNMIPGDLGGVVRRMLSVPSLAAMKKPEVRAAFYGRVRDLIAVNPKLHKYAKYVTVGATASNPEEAHRWANRLTEMLKQEGVEQ